MSTKKGKPPTPLPEDDAVLKKVRKYSESKGISEDEALDLVAEETVIKTPRLPTRTLPGSVYRLMVYQQRIANGEAVYHPNDGDFADKVGGRMERAMYSGYLHRRRIGVVR